MNRQDLKNYKDDKLYIDNEKERILTEYENIQKLTTSFSNEVMGTSPVEDRMAENLAILLDMKRKNVDDMLKLEQKLVEIRNSLEQIEQPFKNILTFVYIEGKSLVEVANIMNYSYREICRKHGLALNKFDEI